MTESIAGKVSRGAAWMISARFVDSGIGMISTIILARLLVPEDFGLVALASSMAAMLSLLQAFGFDVVLIQRQDATRQHFDTAWTLNLGFSVAIAALLFIAAGPVARFYEDPRLTAIVHLMALGKLLEGLENIGTVEFRKEFQFQREFWFVAARRIATFFISVAMVLAYRNYWALVLGLLAGRIVSLLLSYAMHPFRPRFSLGAWGELFGFSLWNAVNASAHALALRMGDMLVGKVAGTAALGTFNLANEIAFLPSTELGAPINRAVYPGYARAAHDRERLAAAFFRVFGLIALLILPVSAGLACTADALVPILLGNHWLAVVPLIPILALRGAIQGLVANVPYVYLAIGKPKLATAALATRSAALIPLLWVGLGSGGLIGAAWGYVASTALEIPVHLFILHRELGVRTGEVSVLAWRSLLATAFMALAVRWVSSQWPIPDSTAHAMTRLGVLVAIGVVSYLASVALLWYASGLPDGAERTVLDAVRDRLAGWSGVEPTGD